MLRYLVLVGTVLVFGITGAVAQEERTLPICDTDELVGGLEPHATACVLLLADQALSLPRTLSTKPAIRRLQQSGPMGWVRVYGGGNVRTIPPYLPVSKSCTVRIHQGAAGWRRQQPL